MEEWPTLLHGVVDKNEPLRKLADEYGVSQEMFSIHYARQREKGE
jgi:hypothetical protein